MKHQIEIDGLRGIAVLSILLFHLPAFSVSGGFVGVDIFYVISGYLIGGQILEQQAAQRFSIKTFYYRRFRRIVPALVAMLVAVTVAALLLFYPTTLIAYAYSMLAATWSVSNIYFWRSADYFAPLNSDLPLLHTWSLGVEEQVYLVLPLLLILLTGRSSRVVSGTLLAIAMLSLALAVAGIASGHGAGVFYLLPTRIWEILLGVLLVRTAIPALHHAPVRELVAGGGALVIATSLLLFTRATPFPGAAALLPCLGTAAVIAAGRAGSSLVTRALSWRPLVFVGLISYSLYLWHWPVIVMMRYELLVDDLDAAKAIVALALSLVLGIASWQFVERPFRSDRIPIRTIYLATAAALGSMTVAGGAIVAAHGLPGRFDPRAVELAAYLGYRKTVYRPGRCLNPPLAGLGAMDGGACLARRADRPDVLILGDSHAAHLWWGLHRRHAGVNMLQFTASGCKLGLVPTVSLPSYCATLNDHLLRTYLPAHKPDLVILAARWEERDAGALAATLAWFRARGIRIVVTGPIQQYAQPLPFLLARQIDRQMPDLSRRQRWSGTGSIDDRIAAVARRAGVPYVSPYRYLCPDGRCITEAAPGVPLQTDRSHLTGAGSIRLAPAFDAVLQAMTSRSAGQIDGHDR